MKKMCAAIAAMLAFACSTPAPAQQALTVTTGAEKGSTYTQMFEELRGACQTPDLALRGVTSTGAVENMDRIVGNKVNMGIVQTDIIWLRGRSDNLSNVKTLVALHPEEVHVVVRADGWRLGATGLFKSFVPRAVDDLAGRQVAAGGGSLITARVIAELARITYEVVDARDGAGALQLLASGKVDAALLVGGAPLGSISGLSPNFRLLRFDEGSVNALSQVYVPAKLSYSNLGAAGITTVATEALLVTQDYRSPGMVRALTQVRACVGRSIDELREGAGTHPKWRAVDPANRGKWPGWWEKR